MFFQSTDLELQKAKYELGHKYAENERHQSDLDHEFRMEELKKTSEYNKLQLEKTSAHKMEELR